MIEILDRPNGDGDEEADARRRDARPRHQSPREEGGGVHPSRVNRDVVFDKSEISFGAPIKIMARTRRIDR